MRILIVGGSGYLGGRIAKYLHGKGHEIILGTRQISFVPDWLPSASIVQVNWDSPVELERICVGMDSIIHTAGMNAENSLSDPVAAMAVNGLATARLLQAAINRGVGRFTYLSTAHVYSNPLFGLINEGTCPLNLHPYGTSHRAGEDVLRAAHRQGKIEGVVIRLSNAFGAPVHREVNCWGLLFNDLCRQAVSVRKMALRSSGLQRRDFIPMEDVCRAVEHLLFLPVANLGDGLFNVGGEWSPTVWDAACLIQDRCEAVLGFRPELTRLYKKDADNVRDLEYRIDLLRKTGFRLTEDKNAEIDHLLIFCQAAFSSQSNT